MFSRQAHIITLEKIAQLERQLGLLLAACKNLVIDSRKVDAGSIFCAYPGTANDGRDFIPVAVEKGARAIFWEPGRELEIPVENFPITNLMHYVGILAAIKYHYPSKSLYNIAVTGTNGKTSISHWLNQAYAKLGRTPAIIGTTGAGIYPNSADYASTTPDPITLQQLLHSFKDEGADTLAMEVSSHGLDQGRVNGVAFHTAIFTNLTQDHLDYHKTMENYFQAKAQLFYWDSLKNAVINCDDIYGQRLLNELRDHATNLNILSYGIEEGELCASNICLNSSGMQFDLTYAGQTIAIQAGIVGRFNIYNLLAVAGTLLLDGVAMPDLPAIMASLRPVTGRMDATIIPGKPLVVVDYSHTPDSLEKALQTLSEIKGNGRLICVFGCGGNRDTGKRPLMGAIAARLADEVVVTTDNPRFEEPEQIIADIIVGMPQSDYRTIVDRKQAIQTAIRDAKAGDIILVAGKGHEDYQEIGGVKHHFSDLELVQELLNEYPV